MGRLLRDPLIHFLAAGAALFALYAGVSDDAGERADRIAVSEAQVARLAAAFERTWMRPPSETELRGLVEDYVTEEILYRQALELGLDRDDLVVRRRMRQKMEFLTEGLESVEPTPDELSAFLHAHPERFEMPARWTFAQVFLRPEGSEEEVRVRAGELLRRLRSEGEGGTDPASLGDPTMLPAALEGATAREVADRFGAAFAGALAGAAPGAWTGPLPSAFGLHLVRVDAYEPARAPALEEVSDAVRRELVAERRAQMQDRLQRSLRERYEIELPAGLAPATEDAG